MLYSKLFLLPVLFFLLLMMAGRLAACGKSGAVYYGSFLQQVLAGAGAWYVCFSVGVLWLHLPLTAVAGLFVCTVSVAFAALRLWWRAGRVNEHYWSVVLVLAVVLVPASLWLLRHQSATLADYSLLNTTAAYFAHSKIALIPSAAVQQLPPAYAALQNLLLLPLQKAFAGVPLVVQSWLLALAAVAAAVAAGIHIKWSNLPLVLGGALVAATLLNPWFSVADVAQNSPHLLFAVTLLAAVLPLCAKTYQPRGWQVVPTALLFSLLAGLQPHGLVWVLALVVVWIVREAVSQKPLTAATVGGFLLLVLLPFVCASIWSLFSGAPLFSQMTPVSSGFFAGNQTLSTLVSRYWPFLLVVAVFGGWWVSLLLRVKNFTDIQKLFYAHGGLTVAVWLSAWVLVGAPLAGLAPFAPETFFNAAQLVLLVPVWQLAKTFYEGSNLQKMAFRLPWGYGLSLCFLFVSLQFSVEKHLNRPTPVAQQQLAATAAAIKTGHLNPAAAPLTPQGAPVSTLAYADGDVANSLLNAAIANHSMGTQVQVVPATAATLQAGDNFDAFLSTLQQNHISHLWLRQPSPAMAALLGGSVLSKNSYLFAVTPEGLRLLEIYSNR